MTRNLPCRMFQALVLMIFTSSCQAIRPGIPWNSNEMEGAEEALHQLELQLTFQNKCLGPEKYPQGLVGGALSCANYLESLQRQECKVEKAGTVMCQEGITAITGYPRGGKSEASTTCEDVGAAADWVLDHCSACSNIGCKIAGQAVVKGNQGMLVTVTGVPQG